MQELANDTQNALHALDSRMSDLETEMDDVAALSAAFSALTPNARASGNTQISLGLGNYGSVNALAMGVYHYVNDNVLINAGASTTFDHGKTAARAGITFGF